MEEKLGPDEVRPPARRKHHTRPPDAAAVPHTHTRARRSGTAASARTSAAPKRKSTCGSSRRFWSCTLSGSATTGSTTRSWTSSSTSPRSTWTSANTWCVVWRLSRLALSKLYICLSLAEPNRIWFTVTRCVAQADHRNPVPSYELYAILNHMGSLGRGHYVAHARNDTDGFVTATRPQ